MVFLQGLSPPRVVCVVLPPLRIISSFTGFGAQVFRDLAKFPVLTALDASCGERGTRGSDQHELFSFFFLKWLKFCHRLTVDQRSGNGIG